MDTVRNDSVTTLALDTIDLEIARWVLDETLSKAPVDRQQYYQLVRDLLDGQGDRRTGSNGSAMAAASEYLDEAV